MVFRYLNDISKVFYDSKHKYDKKVVELFSSILYYGGESKYNIKSDGFWTKKVRRNGLC